MSTTTPVAGLTVSGTACGDCGGSGLIVSGNLFDRAPLAFTLCSCASDRMAAHEQLYSLRRRWDALVSTACVDAGWDAIMDEPGLNVTREDVARALRAAMETALHLDELDSTSFLDSVAQKRIAELKKQLADMELGRGRLAALVRDQSKLSSFDRDALTAYERAERRAGRG